MLYLYENHRLSLAGDKTKIISCGKYIEEMLDNPYEIEKQEIFKQFNYFNPYTEEYDTIEFPIDEEELIHETLEKVKSKIENSVTIDISLARAFLRRARRIHSAEYLDFVFDNIIKFLPVSSDVFLYLHEVRHEDFESQRVGNILDLLEKACPVYIHFRLWLEWYLANSTMLLRDSNIKRYMLNNAMIQNQALAAINIKNVSWARNNIRTIDSHGHKGACSIISSSQILSQSERRSVINNYKGRNLTMDCIIEHVLKV